jgi:hypothetical protein
MVNGTEGRAPARRGVLKALGLAAVAATPAGAYEAGGGTGGLPPAKESEAEKRKPRYRETPHIQAYYRTNSD